MTFPQIENLLLIAPMRIFRHVELRGYFASELMEQGVSQEQIDQMLKMRSTFGWTLDFSFNGEHEYFFFLK